MDNNLEELKLLMQEFIRDIDAGNTPPLSVFFEIGTRMWAYDVDKAEVGEQLELER